MRPRRAIALCACAADKGVWAVAEEDAAPPPPRMRGQMRRALYGTTAARGERRVWCRAQLRLPIAHTHSHYHHDFRLPLLR